MEISNPGLNLISLVPNLYNSITGNNDILATGTYNLGSSDRIAVNTPTIPPQGSSGSLSSFFDSFLNLIPKAVGTYIGVKNVLDNKAPVATTAPSQVISLSTTTPGNIQPIGTTQFNLPPNNISLSVSPGAQGSQSIQQIFPASIMWIIIALLVIVAIAIARKGK